MQAEGESWHDEPRQADSEIKFHDMEDNLYKYVQIEPFSSDLECFSHEIEFHKKVYATS
jgi:hypothetical protein